MAAPTVLQVLDGIEAVLKTIPGLNVTDFAPGQVTPPHALVTVPPINYRETFSGKRWRLTAMITVLTSASLDRPGQRRLAEFAAPTGTRSVFAAFGGPGSGVTLGGLVERAWIETFEPLGWEMVAQIGYYGGQWPITVIAPGD
jgi:hypothetical protein